jgi:hypothetical protein
LYSQTELSEKRVNYPSICALSVSGLKWVFWGESPTPLAGTKYTYKMATKAIAKKAVPGLTKKASGATKTKPKVKK